MPTLRISPDAAAITAAWRPTVPALAVTALDTEFNGFVRTVCARWRAEVLRVDTKVASPNAYEVSCRIRMGVTRPLGFLGSFCDLTPRSSCEDQNWFPRLCQTMSCERTLSGGRVRQSTQERQLRKSWRALNGTGIPNECHIQVTACHRNARATHRLGQSQPVGSTTSPLTITSKWRWQPVEAPVVPLRATTSPRLTFWPT